MRSTRRHILYSTGFPDDPEGELLGFSLTLPNTHDMRRVRLMRTAKRALDYATGIDD